MRARDPRFNSMSLTVPTGLKSKRLWTWLGILAALGIALIVFLLRTQLKQREFGGLQSMRIVIRAAANYHSKFGTYPPALRDLATYEEGWSKSYSTEPVFRGIYYGYHFNYEAPLSSAGVRETFFITAIPFAPENKGTREFCADQTGAIRVANKGSSCTIKSDEFHAE
jgi:hypothetical protein